MKGTEFRGARIFRALCDLAGNLFVNLLKIWPTASPLEIELQRNPHTKELAHTYTRKKKVTTKITLAAENLPRQKD